MKNNIIKNEEFKKQLHDTMETIASSITPSFGPYGATTIIESDTLEHSISKDGFTILNNLTFESAVERTILDLVKNISRAQVDSAGDGSTSSVIAANNLYNSLFYDVSLYKNDEQTIRMTQVDIVNYLEIVKKIISDIIKKSALKIDDENKERILTNVATISTNNDSKIGSFIGKMFKEAVTDPETFIELQTRPGTEGLSYEVKDSFKVTRGIVDQIFVNQEDKKTSMLNNVKVLLIKGRVTDIHVNDIIIPAMNEIALYNQKNNLGVDDGQTLVIVGNSFTFSAINRMKQLYVDFRGQFFFSAIDHAIRSIDSNDKFDDLEVYLNAIAYDIEFDKDLKYETGTLGECDSFISRGSTTQFIGGKTDDTRLMQRINFIDENIELLSKQKQGIYDLSAEIRKYNERKYTLKSNMITLYIGGETPLEAETNEYLIEDAILACKSAFANGITIGGNLIIPSTIFNLKDDIIKYTIKEMKDIHNTELTYKAAKILIELVSRSFITFDSVLRNAGHEDTESIIDSCIANLSIYNLKTNQYESINNTTVINSVLTDIQIMTSCFSIVTWLGTSNQFLMSSGNFARSLR